MEYGLDRHYENKVFWSAVAAAVILHIGAALGLIWAGQAEGEEKFKPLAVMDFAHYDPDGGEADGANSDDVASGPEPEFAPEQEPEAIPEPEPLPAPELEQEPEPEPEVVESVSEKAELTPPLPPKEKPKPAPPKPKAKPKPKPPAEKASTPAASPGGGGPGTEVKQGGGGPGKGRGGVGGGKGVGNPNALKAYTAQVRRRLERFKKYPPSAQANRIQGTVTVSFTIDRSGSLRSPRLVKGSGYAVLDQEVMAMLNRAAPMPPIPKEITQNSISLTVPIRFSAK